MATALRCSERRQRLGSTSHRIAANTDRRNQPWQVHLTLINDKERLLPAEPGLGQRKTWCSNHEERALSTNDRSAPSLLNRLRARVPLTPADEDAILALPSGVRSLRAGEHFLREGDVPTHCCVVLSGFTLRHKILLDGARQILAVRMPGDIVDLQNVLIDRADNNLQALTPAEVATFPRAAVQELAFARPAIGKALWLETLIDGSIQREWIANVGRRDARQRLSHLLCEFAVRLEAAGLGTADCYELPMTQEQLADTVGLTPIHVNRTLRGLDNDGLIRRNKRSVTICDWERLARAAGFNRAYLHLPSRGNTAAALR